MTIAFLLVGLVLNGSWLWLADVACRRTETRGLRPAVWIFGLFQIVVWCSIDPASREVRSSGRATLETASLAWTAAIIPGALAIAAVAALRRRRRERTSDSGHQARER